MTLEALGCRAAWPPPASRVAAGCGAAHQGPQLAACSEAGGDPEVVVLLADAPPGAAPVAGPSAAFPGSAGVTVAYKIPASRLDDFLASTGGRVVAASQPVAAWAGPAAAGAWTLPPTPAPASPLAGAARQPARLAVPCSQQPVPLSPPFEDVFDVLGEPEADADCAMLDCPSLEDIAAVTGGLPAGQGSGAWGAATAAPMPAADVAGWSTSRFYSSGSGIAGYQQAPLQMEQHCAVDALPGAYSGTAAAGGPHGQQHCGTAPPPSLARTSAGSGLASTPLGSRQLPALEEVEVQQVWPPPPQPAGAGSPLPLRGGAPLRAEVQHRRRSAEGWASPGSAPAHGHRPLSHAASWGPAAQLPALPAQPPHGWQGGPLVGHASMPLPPQPLPRRSLDFPDERQLAEARRRKEEQQRWCEAVQSLLQQPRRSA